MQIYKRYTLGVFYFFFSGVVHYKVPLKYKNASVSNEFQKRTLHDFV